MIVSLIILLFIFLVLAVASYQDLKTTTISRETVIALYILVPAFLYASNSNYMIASFCFIFTLITFSCLWFISRKGFGFGDVLVVSALGWMLADFTILRVFLISMGVFSIPWGLFWFWKYKKNPDIDTIWNKKEKRIKQTLLTKKPMPFIPVVFFTMIYNFVLPIFPLLRFI